jgi:hyaluronan synthase
MSIYTDKLSSELSRLLDKKKKEQKGSHEFTIWKKFLAWLLFVSCLIGMIFVNTRVEKNFEFISGLFLSITFVYFLLKMVLSFNYKPVTREVVKGIKVSVVIPSYNENPDAVKNTIECLLEQDYPLHEIIFVDDGSPDTTAYESVLELAKTAEEKKRIYPELEIPSIIHHMLKSNQGKRAAQSWGFKKATGDMIMIVDSDGYIFPDAVRELLKPFNDNKVLAVTGHVNARNLDDNFMTRLQDVLYESAFRIGRGAQSITNTVLVCSGAISMYKRSFILENLNDFENQTLFGKKMNIGDDRRLTTLALKQGGKAKYQSTARCITDVPDTVSKFFKQQVRWSKSFFIDSLIALAFAWKRPFMLLWLLGEGSIWIIFAISAIYTLITTSQALLLILVIYSAGYLALSALANNIYYIFKNPLYYLISPLFALAQMVLVFPIRIYALATINENGWGTR